MAAQSMNGGRIFQSLNNHCESDSPRFLVEPNTETYQRFFHPFVWRLRAYLPSLKEVCRLPKPPLSIQPTHSIPPYNSSFTHSFLVILESKLKFRASSFTSFWNHCIRISVAWDTAYCFILYHYLINFPASSIPRRSIINPKPTGFTS